LYYAAIIFAMESMPSVFFTYWFGGELLTTKQCVGTFLILSAMEVTKAAMYFNMKREASFD
jgi:drug/metabolite transporter (DMT)-like permease